MLRGAVCVPSKAEGLEGSMPRESRWHRVFLIVMLDELHDTAPSFTSHPASFLVDVRLARQVGAQPARRLLLTDCTVLRAPSGRSEGAPSGATDEHREAPFVLVGHAHHYPEGMSKQGLGSRRSLQGGDMAA